MDILLPSGRTIPNIGLGTWYMGESRSSRKQEVAALRYGIEYGARLIDTAEMYGEGEAEKIVAEAMKGYRDQVYLVSKFYPYHAGKNDVIKACERSLKRLNTDCIDLYLLHWMSTVPFEETLEALYQLQDEGKIKDYGVSNLDTDEFKHFCQVDVRGDCATNQVLYNLAHREPEWALKPYCDRRNISMMAYCPLDQGSLAKDPEIIDIARNHKATQAQICLAWLMAQKGVIAIPKSSHNVRVKENLDASLIELTEEEMTLLDSRFPAPISSCSIAIR
ncbi:aldo/keto reductase [Vibrio viridaestus]|uniref:Aldo/keto reductase n=1 Tax=Vibrio viridaestus TaxID=2487322 RepID=A0A3N9TKM6_9VIBR|nr:aldo/keto reductase [Vibrio viridaestus]RQW64403.1 aldo/keto reductase [Vibrio viridaestus]